MGKKTPGESASDFAAALRKATARLPQPPIGISRRQVVQEMFSTDSVLATIHRGSSQSSPEPFGLRYSHLQQSLSLDLAEAISAFSRLVFADNCLPRCLGELHTSVNLSAIGEKAWSVACGDILRSIIGGAFCRQYRQTILEYSEPKG